MHDLGPRTIDLVDDVVAMVDQTALPDEYRVLHIDTVDDLVAAIARLSVRGAPAIGVAGAFGVLVAARQFGTTGAAFDDAVGRIRAARPTAVNLAAMVDRVLPHAADGLDALRAEALAVRDDELAASISLGEYGADLLSDLLDEAPARVMTICNTGGLAAVERGTGLAVVHTAFERGAMAEVIALETRPLLQGARLTAWELRRMGAPHRLIVDSAGPFLLAQGVANVVITGADRIAANGDTANKVGTYSLALGARRAGVPFVVVAPESTVDPDTPDGDAIDIEDRGADEVTHVQGVATAPEGTAAINPAFDVTPVDLIDAIVTDRRVVRCDRGESPADVPLGPIRHP